MADIVLKDRSGNPVTYPGVDYIKLNTATGETQNFATYDPATLKPENLANGVIVGNVIGALETPQLIENLPIELDFSNGDMDIAAPDGQAVKSAIIQKPAGLIPANIAEGVDIGGVVGTLTGGGGVEPYVEYTLGSTGEVIAAKLYGFTAIPPYMFYNLTLLETVDLSESPNITEIGKYAFCACNGLLSISIPDGVTSIGDYAFQNCSKLTSIIIPDSVISIGSNAFAGCSKMETAVIGSGVTKIDNRAFSTGLSTRLITFKVTSGWWYATSATATSGTAIPESSLADPATANTYLSSTYRNNYWRRT